MAGVRGKSGRRRLDQKFDMEGLDDGMAMLPDMPDAGQEYFDLFCARCKSAGVLQQTDEVAMNALVVTFTEWIEAYREVKKNGRYEIDERSGASRVSAWFRIERKLFADLIALCREFGFTPSSRAGLISLFIKEEPKKVEPVSGFISSDPGEPMR